MKRSEKEDYVNQLRSDVESAQIVVAARQGGLTVSQMTDLRAKMREAGGAVKVVKNTLARLAVKGSKCEGIAEHFVGPVVIGYSQDPVAAAKVFVNFSEKNDRMEVLAGNFGGQVLAKSGVEGLAKLPSLDELRGKLVGLLVAPATKIARVVQAPGTSVARVITAYAEK